MWELVIINVLALMVGFLAGVMVGDTASSNEEMENMRKEQRKLKRQIMRLQKGIKE